MLSSGTMPGQRHEAVVHVVDGAAGGAVVTTVQSIEAEMPKRTSLPSKLPPACRADICWSTPKLGDQRVAGLLGRQRHGDPDDEEHRHRRPESPSPAGCRPTIWPKV